MWKIKLLCWKKSRLYALQVDAIINWISADNYFCWIINLESSIDLHTHILGMIVSTGDDEHGCIAENVQAFLKLLLCKFEITARFSFRLHLILIKASVFLQCTSHGIVKVVSFLQREGLVNIYTWTVCNETLHW